MTGPARSQTEIGMLMMAAAMLILPCIDAVAKSLVGIIPPTEIALARFIVQSTVLLPFALKIGIGSSPLIMATNAARGTLIMLATLFFFWALHYLPLAEAISIFFVEPLILTLLSPFLLGERIGWRRLCAVGVGFFGALLIIQPTFQDTGWPALLPLVAALCFAFYLVLTRQLATGMDPIVMQFQAGIGGGLSAAAILLIGWGSGWLPDVIMPVVPGCQALGLLLLLGLIATGGHMLVVHAFRRVNAAILAPFQYLEIISATLLGFLIFGDFPDALTWCGIAVIIGSGLFVFYRERKVQAA
jgi:S-adenosylmethionine uptake transporter